MSARVPDAAMRPAVAASVHFSVPVARAIQTPAGTVAITRSDVVKAGLDSLAVTRWLQPLGGFGGVAYLRPASDRLSTEPLRAALHPISYFVVPLSALQTAGAAETQQTAVA